MDEGQSVTSTPLQYIIVYSATCYAFG